MAGVDNGMRRGWVDALRAPLREPRAVALVATPAVVVLVLITAWASWGDARWFGGMDLRARVVGARDMLAGTSPYFTPADPQVSAERLDPARPADVTRCTYTPATLLVYAPLASLPYRTQRYIWAALEWLALLASIGLFAASAPTRTRGWVLVLGALFFFGSAYFWRLHVERGQYYVFVVLLWAASYALLRRARRGDDWAGVLLGLSVLLRPTAIVMLLPLWLMSLRRTAVAMLITAVLGVALTSLVLGPSSWREFAAAGKRWEQIFSGQVAKTGPLAGVPFTDGYDRLAMLPAKTTNTSVPMRLAKSRVGVAWGVKPALLLGKALCGAAVLAVALTAWRVRRPAGPHARPEASAAMLAAYTVACLADFALPVRYGYSDVVWLAPLALALFRWGPPRLHIVPALALLGLTLGHDVADLDGADATWIRSGLVALALVLHLVLDRSRADGSTEPDAAA